MKLFNTRTRQTETFTPLDAAGKKVTVYSCGPTVYDNIHIGNLSAFITADILRRALAASGYQVSHVMNYTDIDDKTIRRSRERYADFEPHQALKTLTDEYIEIFTIDMRRIGNDTTAMRFVRATDYIADMQALIKELHTAGVAYLADDGVYFSIAAYQKLGRKYGQLSAVTASNKSSARIANDEYDKEDAHDFALWKTKKPGEPAWPFNLDGTELEGRPGWHIECSVMSTKELGQPFDIHTGGVDLVFPHHENEIAQSTSGAHDTYARYFVHNEHLLVDGRKMSKSLGNFYQLENVSDNDIDPLAFRLMMLQSHYRSQTNFTWDNVEAAGNRLNRWRAIAELRWQPLAETDSAINPDAFSGFSSRLLEALQEDLDTPEAMAIIDECFRLVDTGLAKRTVPAFTDFLRQVDSLLGLDLMAQADIDEPQRKLLAERLDAKREKDFNAADRLRDELLAAGLEIRDTPYASLWNRVRRDHPASGDKA